MAIIYSKVFPVIRFISRALLSTSNNRLRPESPYFFYDGETARHIVLLERELSATTKFVVRGFKPRSTHSTEA